MFDKRKPGNGCKEGRENMRAHTFKEGSSNLTSGEN
jgi:hypothetical protein